MLVFKFIDRLINVAIGLPPRLFLFLWATFWLIVLTILSILFILFGFWSGDYAGEWVFNKFCKASARDCHKLIFE